MKRTVLSQRSTAAPAADHEASHIWGESEFREFGFSGRVSFVCSSNLFSSLSPALASLHVASFPVLTQTWESSE
jgi:hypothetical protein